MPIPDAEIARARLTELIDDPRFRPYVFGYLLSCLDERHWADLVQSALEFTEALESHQSPSGPVLKALLKERFS